MPLELDFSRENIAEKLKEWKQEEGRIWGDLTRDMRHELRLRLNEIMEVERDLLVACKWYGTSQARRDERAGYRPRSIDLPQAMPSTAVTYEAGIESVHLRSCNNLSCSTGAEGADYVSSKSGFQHPQVVGYCRTADLTGTGESVGFGEARSRNTLLHPGIGRGRSSRPCVRRKARLPISLARLFQLHLSRTLFVPYASTFAYGATMCKRKSIWKRFYRPACARVKERWVAASQGTATQSRKTTLSDICPGSRSNVGKRDPPFESGRSGRSRRILGRQIAQSFV